MQENACFSRVHRSMNFWKTSCLPAFTGVLLYFLGHWVPVNSSKRLFPDVHRSVNGLKIVRIPTFSSRFLAFPGSVFGCFRCASAGIARSLFAPVRDSFDLFQPHDLLATNVQGTKAHSLWQSKQQKQKALLMLKIWFIQNSVALFTIYRCTIIHIKYERTFNYIFLP